MVNRCFEDFSRYKRNEISGNMIALIVNGLLLLSFSIAVRSAEVMVLGSESRATLLTDRELSPKRCRYNRPYSMLQARCSDLSLEEIPKNLQTDIQILDFSVNRLRELKNETLAAYTSLSYLYLQDNFIQTIEEASFSRLRRLEAIDLTKNGCQDFPKSTLGLPLLRKLFLSKNKLKDESFEPTPLAEQSSLEFLELSKNLLTRLPGIGSLPSLKYLNVSGNLITAVTTEDVAPFCSLEILDLTFNPIRFTSGCDCKNFNAWIMARKIKMRPSTFDCGSEENLKSCELNSESENPNFPNETISLFDSCREVIKTRAETAKARSTWILVASCIGVSLVFLFLTLYCIHKRNNRKKVRQRLKHQQQQQIAANNANTELLNGNMPPEQT